MGAVRTGTPLGTVHGAHHRAPEAAVRDRGYGAGRDHRTDDRDSRVHRAPALDERVPPTRDGLL